MGEYVYYEHDNAYYRGRRSCRWIDDVRQGDRWAPYRGSDSLKPYAFGDEVTREQAERRMPAGG
jgi:hypothetical protein